MILTVKTIADAFENLMKHGYTYVEPRQLLMLYGMDFTDDAWEKAEPEVTQLIEEYFDNYLADYQIEARDDMFH